MHITHQATNATLFSCFSPQFNQVKGSPRKVQFLTKLHFQGDGTLEQQQKNTSGFFKCASHSIYVVICPLPIHQGMYKVRW